MTLHTDIPTRSDLERLITARAPSSVSIYVTTSPITQEAQASRIELKNLATDATEQLQAAGAERRAVAEVRESLDDLADDDEFWAEQAHSLAVFATPEHLRTYRLPTGSRTRSRWPTASTSSRCCARSPSRPGSCWRSRPDPSASWR